MHSERQSCASFSDMTLNLSQQETSNNGDIPIEKGVTNRPPYQASST